MSPKLSADTQRCTVFGRGSYAETLRKATSRPKERVARYPKNMHPCLQRQLVKFQHQTFRAKSVVLKASFRS